MRTLFRNRNRLSEPVWHAQIAMIAAIVLQLLLPDSYVFGSRYILIAAEVLLMLALSFTTPKSRVFKSPGRRLNVFLLIILTGIANGYSLVEVTHRLLQSGQTDGQKLIFAAINIFLTNIIVFALWYWEMDGGGPGERAEAPKHEQDFLFQQYQNENFMHPNWQPTFVDYLYVASTNAMTFGPTDTMPLSRRAKLMMVGQAALSMTTIALVAARAISILH